MPEGRQTHDPARQTVQGQGAEKVNEALTIQQRLRVWAAFDYPVQIDPATARELADLHDAIEAKSHLVIRISEGNRRILRDNRRWAIFGWIGCALLWAPLLAGALS